MAPISIKAEELFKIGSFGVTNSLLLMGIILAVLSGMGILIKKQLAVVPKLFQNFIEWLVEKMLGLMASILGSPKKAEYYFPFIATFFIFILFSNWFGLIPGVGSVGIEMEHGFTPFLRAPSSDINFTLALAVISVVVTNLFAFRAVGISQHLSKFFNFSSPIKFFIGILELISEFSRVISFTFRLFGNIFAGEVLLLIIAFLLPYVGPIPFVLLEVFVGFIQAFVFSMLTLVFLGLHTTSHQESHS